MQLTAHTDYALRVLIYLSRNTDKLVTISELAEFFGISRNHLVKVVHKLGLKGFVRTVRGKGGGIRLSRPAAEINIGAVVREVEGRFQMAECFNPQKQGVCALQNGCRLTGLLSDAVEQFLAVLDGAALSDVALEP
ncbi:Rrf2 family transcriptional regulator [Methylomonas sp. MED-D]|uniref:Rrf2 family transcriptional regulator n=1 Tax=unclassified Methylomonas TaxID=2608980 RepID=UPI0008D95A91|nr:MULTISPECIES: Rrf2 family transcriptional regulator [unclassified Methylomonas]MDT4328356.1 Rrf2 family transcriptional regulator [Methylomonas sp. MV1]NJA06362.1 Rrf2 family transcriptional regulator [Methylococcaceae bacterium WWC4]OHX37244.1 BadM/Rrf2 family transcriptional regulator [Methylomonas sp. LWB]WGS88344.1 Rrf2 family transcriptional regulator [Methylomonas sp. UP202]